MILISNDDGYYSSGIHVLVGMAFDLLDVLVCAPEVARSGFPRTLSVVKYLQSKCRKDIGTAQVWSCNGTPVDCVKLTLNRLCSNRRLALTPGGVNHGDNSSVNNHYSGTVGIVTEGCMEYIPSVAFSNCYYEEDANLKPLRPYVRMVVKKMLADGLSRGTCLNVNFPARQVFEGIKACRMTMGRQVNEIAKQHHPRQYDYYWTVGEYQNDESNAEDSDQWALNHGYVTITSAKMDVTAYEFMNEVREWEKPAASSTFNVQD